MNPLYQMMGGGMPPVVQQFLQFRQNFKGDPKAQVQQMLNSGQITQEQYDRAQETARQIQTMLSQVGRL